MAWSSFLVGLLLATLATANPQTSIRTHTRHLDARVYSTGATPTPTATPCASVGAWTEQAPSPTAVSRNAVSSQGGNLYSFGGIANNIAIANAYKYSPGTNTWMPIASLPAPCGWVQRLKRRHLHLHSWRRGPKLHDDGHALALRPNQQYL
ncbi:MAG: hypothetical protein DME98_14835 [Verrucomicrobia bacterium]|nr:MAG: hypothetical protein DME98_14835 [Verrucomicrobiota bacterium]PYJ32485.1 MAG: hypothetical protein DME88_11055 [Verrucomicrobiota bacterium]